MKRRRGEEKKRRRGEEVKRRREGKSIRGELPTDRTFMCES